MSETVEAAWRRCLPWIEAALDYAGGTHTIEDVEAQIARGEAWFWPGEKSALVTEILEYPQFKAASFWLAGGDLGELLDMTPSVETWAVTMGCSKIFECGRPGWAKALKPLGYAPLYTVVWKDLP